MPWEVHFGHLPRESEFEDLTLHLEFISFFPWVGLQSTIIYRSGASRDFEGPDCQRGRGKRHRRWKSSPGILSSCWNHTGWPGREESSSVCRADNSWAWLFIRSAEGTWWRLPLPSPCPISFIFISFIHSFLYSVHWSLTFCLATCSL